MGGTKWEPKFLQFQCQSCGSEAYSLGDRAIEDYIYLKRSQCKCGGVLDLWSLVNGCLMNNDRMTRFALTVGLYHSVILKCPVGQAYTVNWNIIQRSYPNAKIVENRLTVTEGNLIAVEHEDSTFETSVGLLAHTSEDNYGAVKVEAVFNTHEPDFAQTMVMDAIKLFNRKRFFEMVIPANVAVEIMLCKVLERVFDSIIPHEARKSLFANSLTYGYMLSSMLPITCRLAGFPLLPKEVLDSLTQLRKTRNAVAHNGKSDNKHQPADYARMLSAAAIACRYLFQLDRQLDPWVKINEAKTKEEKAKWIAYDNWKSEKRELGDRANGINDGS